ncbi:MAG TPA: glycosyltransferase family 2 protein [Hanamia sp.]|nr:glycosyltransferase family 2 protein [Hanamia sp.]
MKISGFTFTKNATKLYYPVKASIECLLPLVDEFIVVLGDCDVDDETELEIKSIQSDKIKIIRTNWNLEKYPNGMEYAHQTDIAKEACTGDWLFYIQSDEVVHQKYLQIIRENCEKYLEDKEVEGFLFKYRHFWGDYDHYVLSHAWYPREIRIIRNDPEIHSWRDAQSFRRMPGFNGLDYYKKENTTKLNVVETDAYIFHYGFVRPPEIMQKKRKNHNTNYSGTKSTEQMFKNEGEFFDYGNLSKVKSYKETHPSVMKEFIKKFNWKSQLRFSPDQEKTKLQKHERLKYRFLTFIEHAFFDGRLLFGFKNYKILKNK